jgi:hypothetical protein
MIIYSISALLLFIYFFYLSIKYPLKGINHFIIFTTFYYIIRYSISTGANSILSLWIDFSIFGLSIPILLLSRKLKNLDNKLLIKILFLILYGFILLLITIGFNDLSIFRSIDKYRDLMLFPILAYCSYITIIINHNNSKIIFKTISILAAISVLIFILQYIYINILNHHPTEIFMVKNRYGNPTDIQNYDYEFVPLFYLYNRPIIRVPGIFLQSHQSAHLMAIGFICFHSIFNNYFNKNTFLIGSFVFIIFLCILLSFIKMSMIMIIIYLLYYYWKKIIIKPYRLLIPASLIILLGNIFLPLYERYEIIIKNLPSYIFSSKAESINQFIERNDIITFFTGSGYLDPLIVYSGLSGDDFFIFYLTDQIGIIGVSLFLAIFFSVLFHKFRYTKILHGFKHIIISMKGIILIGLFSTFHYSTIMTYGIQALTYVSVGTLYGLKWWEKNN